MKKLSILLVCCLLVGCSNKSEETSTPSIEETTHPTTIIETTPETTVNEDIIRLESKVAELESKVSELESKLAETSIETTVEETTKTTKPPKETVVVVVTATPTPTESTPIEPTTETTKGEHVCECKSVTISLSTLDDSDSQNYHRQVYRMISDAVTHKNCDYVLTPSGMPGIDFQLSPGTYKVRWYGDCGEYYQTVIITD